MSEKIVQLNEEVIKGQLKELVRGSVEEALIEMYLAGGSGRRLYCRLTSFSQSLQTFLRITLDGTKS